MGVDRSGTLLVPLLLFLLLIASAGLGVGWILHDWKKLVETQFRLDQCVARASLKLKRHLNRIERMNTEMTLLRATIAAGTLVGEPLILLKSQLTGLALAQEADLTVWKTSRAAWISRVGCTEWRDRVSPLPEMPWVRDPDDVIGPKPLRWPETESKALEVHLARSPRAASAKISKEGWTHVGRWKAVWQIPHLGETKIWPGID
ncbi:hypothetical protein K2X30_02635 [bacterium]|nr:hypothetical protein [bacterium]